MHYVSKYLDLALRLFKLCVACIDLDYQVCCLQCYQTNDSSCRKLVSTYPKLHFFEICVLANLAPGDVEEAKILVPSLMVRHAVSNVHMLTALDMTLCHKSSVILLT